MRNLARVSTRAELTEEGKSKMSKVINFATGNRVEVPINKDGSVKWFDDSRLKKKKN